MQVTRKIVAAGAAAVVATLGLATAAGATMLDNGKANTDLADSVSKVSKHHDMKWYWVKDDGGLLAIDKNNVGPVQACHNFVPVNVLGVQVPVKDITGIVGIDQDDNTATAVKTCDLASRQNNDSRTRSAGGYGSHDNGDRWYSFDNDNGLLSVSNNNVGPFQVCHNEVPVNVLGVQVPISNLNGLLGLDQNENAADQLQTCELDSSQNN